MENNPKIIVEQAYDYLAAWYLQWVTSQPSPREIYTKKILEALPTGPHILELGCGPGVPITRMLLDCGARVVANDISHQQIDIARVRCPEATYIKADMTELTFASESFDGIICFYTIFHLPRAEQKPMFSKIYTWLKPGGYFTVNLATIDEEEVYGEMMGHGMFWSSYSVAESKVAIVGAGFEIIAAEEIESGDGKLEEGDADYGVTFVWVAARKSVKPPS